MTQPACWSWPARLPTEADARREIEEYAERNGCTPGQTEVLWSLERAAGAVLGGEDLLVRWHQGRCAICGSTSSELVCDHDHVTGLVRGWLCRSCNTREGTMQQPDTVFSRYRERPPAQILGLTIRYLHPVTGEYAKPQLVRETDWEELWSDAASEDIGL